MTRFHFLRTFLLTALIVAAVQASAFAAMKSYTVINQTGRTISAIYAVASGQDNPREFNLIKAPLEDGQSVTAEYDSDFRKYDITAVFEDGEVAFWDSVDHKKAVKLFIYKDGKGYNVDTD